MGLAADVGRGLATAPDPDEPGLRQGYPAILSLLSRYDVPATFFVEGWNGVHHPKRVEELLTAGHEVGAHGWVHEAWSSLDAETENELLGRALGALNACGAEVTGFRSPGGERSDSTIRLLADAGLRYDASLDVGPAYVSAEGVAVLPFEWSHVDWHWFGAKDVPAPPSYFAAALRKGLEHAALTAEPLVVIAHARTSALRPERLNVLEQFVRAVIDDGRFSLLRMNDVATDVLDNQPE